MYSSNTLVCHAFVCLCLVFHVSVGGWVAVLHVPT